MTRLDWAIIAIYFVFVALIGVAMAGRAGRSLSDYFLGSRSLPGVQPEPSIPPLPGRAPTAPVPWVAVPNTTGPSEVAVVLLGVVGSGKAADAVALVPLADVGVVVGSGAGPA